MTEIIKTKCPVCGQPNENVSQLDLDDYPKNEQGDVLVTHEKCLLTYTSKKKRKCKLHHKCRRCSSKLITAQSMKKGLCVGCRQKNH